MAGLADIYLKGTVALVVQAVDVWQQADGAATETTITAKVNHSTRLIRNRDGEIVNSSAQVLMATRTLAHSTKIKVTDQDGTERSRSIIDIRPKQSWGTEFLEVFLT